DGTIVRLGGRTHKNKAGFDLHRLFVGSEGLLGIVTEATLKLLPLPPFRALLVAGFSSAALAASALRAVLRAGFLPCALEIADEFTLVAARKRTGSKRLEGSNSILFVELDGYESSVRSELIAVEKIISKFKPMFIDRAFGASECEKLWELRREFSYALRDTGLTKLNEDVVVPRSRLEDLFVFAAQLQKKFNLPVACFGHAGDGNIHVNIMVDFNLPQAREKSSEALNELFKQIVAWGGVITGEHGIGVAKKPWWENSLNKAAVELHKKIKKALDPKGILNPGKFV
ncbi:MAG: FAD-binding oxidoreductase, partial [Limisphaerales bacterium]